MSDYNLAALSPEEKDQLLSQLLAKHDGGSGPEPDGAVQELLKVVEILCNVVEQQGEELAMLKKVVMEDIVGGVETLYKGNLRTKGVEGLRGKYGSMFEPHGDALKELSPDEDVFDKLYDMIEEAKGGEGWDDGKEGDLVNGMVSGIAGKIAKIRGDKPSVEIETEEPVAEVTKVEVSGAPEGMDPKLFEQMNRMKAANAARGK